MERNDTVVMEDEELGLVDDSAESPHGDMYSAVLGNSPAIGIANWRHPKGDLANFPKVAEVKGRPRDIPGEMIARSSVYLGLKLD